MPPRKAAIPPEKSPSSALLQHRDERLPPGSGARCVLAERLECTRRPSASRPKRHQQRGRRRWWRILRAPGYATFTTYIFALPTNTTANCVAISAAIRACRGDSVVAAPPTHGISRSISDSNTNNSEADGGGSRGTGRSGCSWWWLAARASSSCAACPCRKVRHSGSSRGGAMPRSGAR